MDSENWLKYGLSSCGLLVYGIDSAEILVKFDLFWPEVNMSRVRPKPVAQANCPLEKSGRFFVEYGSGLCEPAEYAREQAVWCAVLASTDDKDSDTKSLKANTSAGRR